ncbi:MAG: peptide-methionine (S)-S-oxide reductase MsrA [Povalibacter sp.]
MDRGQLIGKTRPHRSCFLIACTMAFAAPSLASLPTTVLSRPATALTTETAVLAGGCFWGVEAVFEHVKGVRSVVAGYAGGEANTASYERVGSGRTGHAEAVQIVFEPGVISYSEVLRIFFSVAHDPTQLNRQGPDVGSQYRSAIFYADKSQQETASAYIAQLTQQHLFARPIVTSVDSLRGFYPAENYHQDFIARNPTYPYVVMNDLPKIRNLKRLFPDAYREWNAPSTYTSL